MGGVAGGESWDNSCGAPAGREREREREKGTNRIGKMGHHKSNVQGTDGCTAVGRMGVRRCASGANGGSRRAQGNVHTKAIQGERQACCGV